MTQPGRVQGVPSDAIAHARTGRPNAPKRRKTKCELSPAKPTGLFCPVGRRQQTSTGHEAGPRLLGVLDGGDAVEPLELPAELRWALVPDRPGGGARVVALVGHEPLGVVEPDSLEVLERRARRHELEVVVEGREAHTGLPRQIVDAVLPRVIGMDLPQDPGDAGEVVVPARQGPERAALLALEHAIDNLPDRLASEDAAVGWPLEALQEADDGTGQLLVQGRRGDAPRRRGDGRGL